MTRLLGYGDIRRPKIVRGYQTSISLERLKELLPSGWTEPKQTLKIMQISVAATKNVEKLKY